jgi:hypothetical protein
MKMVAGASGHATEGSGRDRADQLYGRLPFFPPKRERAENRDDSELLT